MKRIRISKPSTRREMMYPEDLPADPRDPDVVRAKALTRAQATSSSRTNLVARIDHCQDEPLSGWVLGR
jgi:hypothetical protein